MRTVSHYRRSDGAGNKLQVRCVFYKLLGSRADKLFLVKGHRLYYVCAQR